ncbi:MAG TPA: VWA domain-containing protein [Pyrinomonadaceae bacterium]|jgi:VWFA-related protein|nr:VWA domain-containing protein [Pyrinomonadaceae bacterium]
MKIKAFLVLLMAVCIVLPALAQTQTKLATPRPAPPQKPSDDTDDVVKISTNLVQVDAVVTRDGKAVADLTADDFEIYEDGHKQTITSFAYISNIPKTIAPAVVPERTRDKKLEGPPAAPVNANEPHRTIAFVVDDLGISAESMGLVRSELRKFIREQLQPNDLVAIIRTGGQLGVLQQFTNDKRLLNRALERTRWNPCSRTGFSVFRPAGSMEPDDDFRCGFSYQSTGKALRYILDGMAQLPGRKSMILLSDDIPLETQDYRLGTESEFSRGTITTFPNNNLSGMLQRIAEKAIRASVVIYSVDTQALQYTGPTAADSLQADPLRPQGDARRLGEQIGSLMSARSGLLVTRREGGELIARQTGGFQVRNSNSFKLDQILEDQSGYYLLGYRPTDETFNRRFHHIKAKVKRSGMNLRTRFGFWGVSEEDAKKSRPSVGDLTNLALISPFAAQDINVDITSFFAKDKTGASVVRSFVYLDPKDMTFSAVGGRQQVSFELHGIVFGDNGTITAQLSRRGTVTLSQQDYEYALRNGMGLTFDMPVKRPGSYQMRIAARDTVSSRIGSAGEFVAVPDLNNKKLAVSGVVLGSESDGPGVNLAKPDLRRFPGSSDLHFGYVIYNATNESGAMRNLVMQAKVFRDGKSVYSGQEVPVSASGSLTDPSRLLAKGVVRLATDLEPGSYYLQVTLTEVGSKKKDATVVQWADFEIEK